MHGSPSIPPHPASHGCARLSNAAIDFIWAANLMPIGTPVWVYS
jgi:lipoprotein-anchoring transpeptidase ErfK/SrfK